MDLFKKISSDALWTIEAASPDDLKTQILKGQEGRKDYVSLVLSDPQILICPFQYPGVAAKNLLNRIKVDMVEVLSLPVDEIKFDYQIFNMQADSISGIYLSAPKSLIDSYLAVTDEYGLIVTRVTVDLLNKVEALFKQITSLESRFAVLDFSIPNHIFLSVFMQRRCELLRKIHFEDTSEAIHEIIQSLRCASTKSQIKNFDFVYCLGDYAGKNEISNAITRIYHAEIREGFTQEAGKALGSPKDDYFKLNLIRDMTFSLAARRKILLAVNAVLFVCALIVLGLLFKVLAAGLQINKIRSSFDIRKVEQAKKLQARLTKK